MQLKRRIHILAVFWSKQINPPDHVVISETLHVVVIHGHFMNPLPPFEHVVYGCPLMVYESPCKDYGMVKIIALTNRIPEKILNKY